MFDPTKDKTIKETLVEADKEGNMIELKLVSYDGGSEKVQISRFEVAEGGERKYRKLGRMSVGESRRGRDAITKFFGE
jgi:hypothetical protein